MPFLKSTQPVWPSKDLWPADIPGTDLARRQMHARSLPMRHLKAHLLLTLQKAFITVP